MKFLILLAFFIAITFVLTTMTYSSVQLLVRGTTVQTEALSLLIKECSLSIRK